MSLNERINRQTDRREAALPAIHDRRQQPERRSVPRWIERKNEQGLPAKDLTGKAA